MYRLCTLLFSLLFPFAFLRLWRKGRANPAYREHWQERLGHYPFHVDSSIWIHAVSLGEMVAAGPLIEALLTLNPSQKLVLSCMTPTGRTEAQKWSVKFPNRVFASYVPYDLPFAIQRALRHIHPKLLIVMETELWPNLFRVSKIPVFIVNARISDRALPRYQKIRPLMKYIFRNVNCVLAQSELDAERFSRLGAKKVITMGNLKYDLSPPTLAIDAAAALHSTWDKRLILTAASTHEGEERAFIEAYQQLKPEFPALLLVLIPRHPERFNQVEALCREMNQRCLKRSENRPVTTEDIFLVDAMGEVKTFYALSDLVFVGGSLVPIGGHNILEAAILEKPIIVGPYMQNARAIVQDFLAARALIQIDHPLQLTEALQNLLSQPELRQSLASHALEMISKNRGALDRLLNLIAPYY